MDAKFMKNVQESADAVWLLGRGASMTLRIGPGPRILQVLQGRLWVTTSGTRKEAATDVWLEPGEALELAHGLALVVEGWPQARFQLLVPPSVCARAANARPRSRVLAWVARLPLLPSPLRARIGTA